MLVELFQDPLLPLPDIGDMSVLDGAEAADLLGQPGQLNRKLVIVRVEILEHTGHKPLIVGDQLPLTSTFGGMAEWV